jgi:hypothetical protein
MMPILLAVTGQYGSVVARGRMTEDRMKKATICVQDGRNINGGVGERSGREVMAGDSICQKSWRWCVVLE